MTAKAYSFHASMTWVDWAFSMLAFAAILFGLAFKSSSTPEQWAYIAGPLFALASGLLFFVALRVQLRSHAQAVAEMQQTNLNHSQILEVAKHEKEFSICLQAITRVESCIQQFSFDGMQGLQGIEKTVDYWNYLFFHKQNTKKHSIGYFELLNTNDEFPSFDKLHEINVYMYWVLHAISRKELAEDDRGYLSSLIAPIIRNVGKSQTKAVSIIERMEELLNQDDEQLASRRIERVVLQHHKESFQNLFDQRKFTADNVSKPN